MKNKQEGCISAGLKLTMIGVIIIAICLVLFSCASTKEGCGTEHYKHAFNK